MFPLLHDPPDLLVVQGDTSSALGAALAAFTAGIPVAHVEAGLRTHDPMLPWPEEEYRTAIDAHADLLFAPTELAAANLRTEQVPGEIHVTGNTSIDAVLEAASRLQPPLPRNGPSRILVTCHRRESWHEGLESIAAAVRELAGDGAEIDFVLHPNAFVADKMRRFLAGCPRITLIEPCSHDELLRRMRDADLVLSDSGGIQEEAPSFGVPALVLRDVTERVESLHAGCAKQVGTDEDLIVREATRLLDNRALRDSMTAAGNPYGDGIAAVRTEQAVAALLGLAAELPQPMPPIQVVRDAVTAGAGA
jgi:UDP-N-acetylglucosamine 2-epimerase (non-hydrolysing)